MKSLGEARICTELTASSRLAIYLALLSVLPFSVAFPMRSALADDPPPCDGVVCPPPLPPPGAPPDPGGAFPKVVQHLEPIGSATPTGTLYLASNSAPVPQQWIWQIEPMCDVLGGDCVPGDFCAGPDQGVYMDINVKPLAQAGNPTLAQPDPPPIAPDPAPGRAGPFETPPPATPVGATYTGWLSANPGCVDVSQLNLPPTPEEVYEQFIALPIPGLGFDVQPPDLGLVNLPEIFYTTEPTSGMYTVDIRGYTVVLSTEVAQFRWYTGDAAEPLLTSAGPGLPYPNQYVTHLYLSRGNYIAVLETIWQATYTVDGGPSYAVPGTVTTTGPPRMIVVVEAHPVLTDPYD